MNIKELKEKYHIVRIWKGRKNLSAEVRYGNRVYRFTEQGPKRLLSHMNIELFSERRSYENYAVFCVDEISLYGTFSYRYLCRHPQYFEYILNDTQEDWALRIRTEFGVLGVVTNWDSLWLGDPQKRYTMYSLDTGKELYSGTYGGALLEPRSLVVFDGWAGSMWYAVDPDQTMSYEELYKSISNFFSYRNK